MLFLGVIVTNSDRSKVADGSFTLTWTHGLFLHSEDSQVESVGARLSVRLPELRNSDSNASSMLLCTASRAILLKFRV